MDLDYLEMLIENVKNGDKTSIETILTEFKPFISCYSKKIHHSLKYGYEICDIENECYSTLLITIKNYTKPSSKFVFYALSAIKRSCISLIRYWNYRKTMGSTDANDDIINQIPGNPLDEPFAYLNRQADFELINKTLLKLSSEEQQLLKMIFFDGMSIAEYARRVGIRYNVAAWKKRQAINKAKKLN